MATTAASRPLVKFELHGGEIHRLRIDGEAVTEDKIVAHYDAGTKAIKFANVGMIRHYKDAVTAFLAEQDFDIRRYGREDVPADPAVVAPSAPKRPKADQRGDLTPAVVEWFQKYRPNEFATRYGQLFVGDGADRVPYRFTGQVKRQRTLWEKNINGDLEFKGNYVETVVNPDESAGERIFPTVTDVIVTLRSTHLSYRPEECVGFDESLLEEQED